MGSSMAGTPRRAQEPWQAAVGRLTPFLLVASLAGCESVPLLSPGGSTILLQANPSFVRTSGGRSLVTAVLTEPAGTTVPDGTVVYFFTDLGQIEGSAKTVAGIARVYFVSDARSGQACVVAYSGGAAPTCAPGSGDDAAAGPTTGEGSASVTISVGSALPAHVIVTADPPGITNPHRATITANVFDANGNPVQNVPVVFRITDFEVALEETLDSGGSPRYTDSNGQAFDTLRTRRLPSDPPKEVTVSAAVPGIETDASVVVHIN